MHDQDTDESQQEATESVPSTDDAESTARDCLASALDAEDSAEKNYHVRRALQLLVAENECDEG